MSTILAAMISNMILIYNVWLTSTKIMTIDY